MLFNFQYLNDNRYFIRDFLLNNNFNNNDKILFNSLIVIIFYWNEMNQFRKIDRAGKGTFERTNQAK